MPDRPMQRDLREQASPARSAPDAQRETYMRATTIVRRCIFCVLLFLSASSGAAIVVVPGAPISTQDVHIQVVNQYGPATSILGYTVSGASIVSATITRSGNQFSIDMTVDVVCPGSPTALTLTTDFDVGVLNAGTYQVVARITHRSHFPTPCGGPSVTQSASFDVADPVPVPVPAGSPLGYLIAACLLAFFAYGRLKRSDRREA
jgi:hypothetical protein